MHLCFCVIPHERKIHMKTLLLTPTLAIGLGLAGNTIAEIPMVDNVDTTALVEIVTHKKVSLTETRDFYQGDFLLPATTRLKGLTQNDLYTGRGASESSVVRYVTY